MDIVCVEAAAVVLWASFIADVTYSNDTLHCGTTAAAAVLAKQTWQPVLVWRQEKTESVALISRVATLRIRARTSGGEWETRDVVVGTRAGSWSRTCEGTYLQ